MNEPERYLDGDRADLKARLLASASDDAPSARSMQRALAVAAAVGAATATTGAASGAVTTSTALWLKWLAVGALAGFVAAGSAGLLLEDPRRPPPAPTPALPAPPARAEVPASKPVVAPLPEPAPSAAPEPRAAPPAPAALPAPLPEEPKDTLGAELERIDLARKRQASGDAQGALAELDRYARDYPRARFGEEARLIRAESLAALGDCSAARRLASAAGDGGVLARRWKALGQRCP